MSIASTAAAGGAITAGKSIAFYITMAVLSAITACSVIGVALGLTYRENYGLAVLYKSDVFQGQITMQYSQNLSGNNSVWSSAVTKEFSGKDDNTYIEFPEETVVELFQNKSYVVFSYHIVNTSAFEIDVSLNYEDTGYQDTSDKYLRFVTSNQEITTLRYNRDFVETDWANITLPTLSLSPSGEANDEGWVYVLVAVKNLNADFQFSGAFTLSLTSIV